MISVKNISLFDIFIFIAAFLFYGTLYPAFWNQFLIGPGKVSFQIVFLAIWAILVLIRNQSALRYPDKKIFIFLSISSLYYVCHSLVTGDNIAYLLYYIEGIIAIFLAYNSFPDSKFIKYVLWLNVLMVIMNSIGTVLAYLGILHPIGAGINMEADGAMMQNYGLFLVKSSAWWDSITIRGSGFYDEPGSLSFVIFLLLSYNKLHGNSRKIENILLIGGLFTLSAAHIVLTAVYIIFFYMRKGSGQLLALMLIVAGIVWFVHLDSDNIIVTEIQKASIGRIGNIADGTDASRNYKVSKKAFDHYFPIGTSMSDIDSNFPGATHETIWYFLARFGLIGSLILYFPIIYLLFYYARKKGLLSDEVKLLLILVINCYQRPSLYTPLYLTILFFTWFDRLDKSQVEQICDIRDGISI